MESQITIEWLCRIKLKIILYTQKFSSEGNLLSPVSNVKNDMNYQLAIP